MSIAVKERAEEECDLLGGELRLSELIAGNLNGDIFFLLFKLGQPFAHGCGEYPCFNGFDKISGGFFNICKLGI